MSSDDRMTSCVRLSSARPRNPLTSPGASQESERLRASGAVESPRLAPDPMREIHAPRQLTAMRGNRRVIELHHWARALPEHQARSIRDVFSRLIVLEHRLYPRILALGVRVEEHLEPARDLVVRAAREHAAILAFHRAAPAASSGVRSRRTAPCRGLTRALPRSALVEAARQTLLAAFFVHERGLPAL